MGNSSNTFFVSGGAANYHVIGMAIVVRFVPLIVSEIEPMDVVNPTRQKDR